jgi:exopolysaccharide biosynthesis polyprenyl glycosylphosphotransferase
VDAILALGLAALWLGANAAGIVFAAVATAALTFVEPSRALAVGQGHQLRLLGRFGIAAMAGSWASLLVAPAGNVGPGHACLVVATVGSWLAVRLAWSVAERRRPERVAVMGHDDCTVRTARRLEQQAGGRVFLVGYVGEAGAEASPGLDGLPRLGYPTELGRLLEHHAIDRVLIAQSVAGRTSTADLLRDMDEAGVRIDVLSALADVLGPRVQTYALGGAPVLSIAPRQVSRVHRAFKRALDVAVAGVLLVLVAPVLLAVAVAIKFEDGGRALYRQRRVGRRGMPFEILKFRSMVDDAEALGLARIEACASIGEAVTTLKQDRDRCITRVGDFIRRTSLDELPQLWNVLRGDMSIVGPRPLRPFEVEALSSWELTRHMDRPGITGLWQVTGRSNVDWDDRMGLDYKYVRHWSLAGDFEIMARTLPAVLRGDGAR